MCFHHDKKSSYRIKVSQECFENNITAEYLKAWVRCWFPVNLGVRSNTDCLVQLNDEMSAKGWHLSALIKPAAVHFCFTHQHARIGPSLCADLLACCAIVRQKIASGEKPKGKAKIYGMSNSIPDRQGLGDLLHAYQDIILSP